MATAFTDLALDENGALKLIEQYKQAFPADADYYDQKVQQHGALYVGQTLTRLGSPELVQEYNQRVRMGLNEPKQVLKDLAQGWRLEQAMETRPWSKARWRGDAEQFARGWYNMPAQAERFGKELYHKPLQTTGKLIWSQLSAIPVMAASTVKTLAGQEGGLNPLTGAGEAGGGMGLAGALQMGAMAAGFGAAAKGVRAGALAKPPQTAMQRIAAGVASPVAATLGHVPVKPMIALGQVGDVLEAEIEELVGGTISNVILGSLSGMAQKGWNAWTGRADENTGAGLDDNLQPEVAAPTDPNLPAVDGCGPGQKNLS